MGKSDGIAENYMLYLISASLIWCFSFGLIGNTLAGLPPAGLAASRLLLAALIFVPFIKRIKFKTGANLFLIGAIQFGLMYLAYMYSFQTLKSHEVALFTVFTPIYISLINDIQKRVFHPRNLLMASLAVIGAAIILWNKESRIESLTGFCYLQMSGICFALGQLLYRKAFIGHSDELPSQADKNIFAWLYIGGFTILLPFALGDILKEIPHPNIKQIATIIYLGAIASGLAFFLWNKGARTVSTATLAVMNNLKIPTGVLISLLVFREKTNLTTLLTGATLIAAAVFITIKRDFRLIAPPNIGIIPANSKIYQAGCKMQVPLLDLKAQYRGMRDEIRQAMDEVCDAQQFVLGPVVEQFEAEMAAYCGTRHAVGMSSGTDALLAALMALNIGPGDTVITSPFTFFATAGTIARTGARPVFADIDPVSFNLDPEQVRQVLAAPPERFKGCQPKALLPVHLFGQCADMAALLKLGRTHGCPVIEDAAQAIGAEYPTPGGGAVRAGSMGVMGCFSFFPSKNLGGFGDGGLVTANDDALAASLQSLRMHGATETYYHRTVGGNFRLDALQAAVLRVKLKHLDAWHTARQTHAAFYNQAFAGSCVVTPQAVYAGVRHGHIYNQYVVRVPQREALRQRLLHAGVGCAVYYPLPLHMQECFKMLGYQADDFPESQKAAREVLALPVYPELTEAQLEYVARTVLEAVA